MTPIDLEGEFERFMAAAYPTVQRTSNQWTESRRIFIAGVHLAVCRIKNAKLPRLAAADIAEATLAFGTNALFQS